MMDELIKDVADAMVKAEYGQHRHLDECSVDNWLDKARAAIEEIQSQYVILDLDTGFAIPDVQGSKK